jgi:hypothetical protein
MFENAQQEPSGGNTKTVAGVIVVLMAILGGVYFVYFRGPAPATAPAAAPAAETAGGGTPAANADYKLDLAIQKNSLGRDQTQTMAMWDIQIYNRSRQYAYRNIKYATNYYDAGGNVIHQGGGTLEGEVQPGDYRTITGVNDGLYPLATVRYTFEITGADGVTP